jgi:protein SCO1/2
MSLPARRTTVLATLLAIASLLVACAEDPGEAGAGSSPSASPSATAAPSVTPSTPAGWAGTVLAEPLPVGDFTLTDQRGKSYRFPKDADGTVTLLYFGYTHCADICPGTLAAIAVALRGLPPEVADEVAVVFATVDPARDTVEVVRDWVGLFSDDFTGLTGSQEEVEAALATYGFAPPEIFDLGGGEYTVGHPAGVLAFTPDGLAHLEYPFGVTVEGWQLDRTTLVDEGWEEP